MLGVPDNWSWAVFLIAQNKTTSFLYRCQAFDFWTKQIVILLLLASTAAVIQLGESKQESICIWSRAVEI